MEVLALKSTSASVPQGTIPRAFESEVATQSVTGPRQSSRVEVVLQDIIR